MIYNENGIIINDEYNLLQSELHLDSLLQEAITFKDVKRTAAQLGRWIIDKLAAFIDWLEKLKYHKQINTIKTNKDKIKEILEKMYKEDDYAKVIKGTIAGYLESEGLNYWFTNFDEAVQKTINNPSIPAYDIELILYGDYLRKSKNFSKEAFFKKENAEISIEKIKGCSDNIIGMAINVEENIKIMRKVYSKLKVFSFEQNKDEKIKHNVMEELHSYLINGIKSYKNLSTACIELCVKAFNLYNKYNGDMDKVNEEISTYDMSDEKQKEYVKNYRYKKIKNPSDSTNLEAIRKNPYIIKKIENPTEEMQLAAVLRNINTLEYIKNPTEKVIKSVIYSNHFSGYLLKDVDLSESIQLIIINKNPRDIKYIKNPTEKVKKIAEEKIASIESKERSNIDLEDFD